MNAVIITKLLTSDGEVLDWRNAANTIMTRNIYPCGPSCTTYILQQDSALSISP